MKDKPVPMIQYKVLREFWITFDNKLTYVKPRDGCSSKFKRHNYVKSGFRPMKNSRYIDKEPLSHITKQLLEDGSIKPREEIFFWN